MTGSAPVIEHDEKQMDPELMRRFTIYQSFYDRVSTLAFEYHAKTITAERLAERVVEMSQSYDKALHKKTD